VLKHPIYHIAVDPNTLELYIPNFSSEPWSSHSNQNLEQFIELVLFALQQHTVSDKLEYDQHRKKLFEQNRPEYVLKIFIDYLSLILHY